MYNFCDTPRSRMTQSNASGATAPLESAPGLYDDALQFVRDDLEEQRQVVAWEAAQRQQEYCAAMSAQQHMRPEAQEIALKVLMREANVRDVKVAGIDRDVALRKWCEIASSAMDEYDFEGHGVVQRRLSCMCIFSPVPQPDKTYDDNDLDRLRRMANQQAILSRLRAMQYQKCPEYFLHSAKEKNPRHVPVEPEAEVGEDMCFSVICQ